ncbi:TerD family protein, partial [Streptomyces chattanoogensis]|uniref:TerD family protein n=1 Tax=Streptomyces chattanoogensis TaxID=66876 RepID=UPI0014705729
MTAMTPGSNLPLTAARVAVDVTAPAQLDVSGLLPAAVPEGIEKIVVTASLDAPGTTFAGTEPTGTVRNADDGSVIATFTPPQLGAETALIVVEIYRRNGAWKVRAVGQGYADGLAGIATDFGVSVDEPAAPPGPRQHHGGEPRRGARGHREDRGHREPGRAGHDLRRHRTDRHGP